MAYPFRPYKAVFTAAEIIAFCKNAKLEEGRTSNYLVSSFRPPFSQFFSGKRISFRFDHGTILEYHFVDDHTLRWTPDGERFYEEYYEALESTVQNVFLIHHLRRHDLPFECATLIVDMDASLVTWVDMRLGTTECDRNVNRSMRFGYFGEDTGRRHTFTEELCGVILDWKYSETFIIRHEYITPDLALSPGEPTENAEDYLYRKFLPARYVKIRPELYVMSFIEDGGTEICFLIDMNKLRNVGAFFGMGEKGSIACFTVGAIAGRGRFGFNGEYAIAYGPEAEG